MELVVFGGEVAIPGVRVRCEPWSATGEVPLIRTFDVGLKPLPRTDWVRGKCPMKELQYMALGIPPLATALAPRLPAVATQLLSQPVVVGAIVALVLEIALVQLPGRKLPDGT